MSYDYVIVCCHYLVTVDEIVLDNASVYLFVTYMRLEF